MEEKELLKVFDLKQEEVKKLAGNSVAKPEIPGSWKAYSGSRNYIECKEH